MFLNAFGDQLFAFLIALGFHRRIENLFFELRMDFEGGKHLFNDGLLGLALAVTCSLYWSKSALTF